MTQAQQLRSLFPGCKSEVGRRKLIWCYDLQPTAHSRCYTVKIKYHPNSKGVMTPDIYVMFPKHLPLAEGKYKLPHVYCNESQKICLYDWRNKEWNPTMSLASTIVPWASEWLYFYEVWVMTGEWYGEGNHPGDNKEEKKDNPFNKQK